VKDHEEELSALDYFFQPRSIALVGASGDPAKPGGRCLTALVRRRYPGNLYPINNRHRELLGLPCYPSLKDIPTEIDMVIISVPAHQTLDVLREAAEKQARVAVIFTSGFSEVGSEGQRLQEELKKRQRSWESAYSVPTVWGSWISPSPSWRRLPISWTSNRCIP